VKEDKGKGSEGRKGNQFQQEKSVPFLATRKISSVFCNKKKIGK